MLGCGLTCTETTRDGCCTALGNGEEKVNDTLAGDQWFFRLSSEPGRTRCSYRPFLVHFELVPSLSFILNNNQYCFDIVTAVFSGFHNSALYVRRHHEAVLNHQGFLYSPKDLSGFYGIANTQSGFVIPHFFFINGHQADPFRDKHR